MAEVMFKARDSVDTTQDVVFGRRPDITAVEQCSQCSGWIVGGTSYFSDGKIYCPKCMFDDGGKFVDSVSMRVKHWKPTANMARISAGGG